MSNQELKCGALLQGGKYRIDGMLGQGGFGITYLATQTQLGRREAIKEFFLKDLCERRAGTGISITAVTQTEMVDRYKQKFKKEAMMMARFDHPNIVRVHDVFEENGTWYYSMDYVEGRTLDAIVKERGRLPEAEALYYIRKVSEALTYIHAQRVNHLDIKPSNIMVRTSDNTPVLIDFGISKQYDERKNETSTTPPGISKGYSPLEQYRAGGVSTFLPQADVYALGATLYKMVTGQTPPEASDVLNNGITGFPAGVSPQVMNAIIGAMQPRTTDRFPTVQAFLQVLAGGVVSGTEEQAEGTLPYGPAQPPVAPPPYSSLPYPPSPTPSSSLPKILCVVLAVVVALMAALGLAMCNGEGGESQTPVTDEMEYDSLVADSDSVVADYEKPAAPEPVKTVKEKPAEPAPAPKAQGASGSYTLAGEMVGYPMTVKIKLSANGSLTGTYHNTTYGTKMAVRGSYSNGSLSFTGTVQGSTFTFELYETSGSDFQSGKRFQGTCYTSGGQAKSLWLTVQ